MRRKRTRQNHTQFVFRFFHDDISRATCNLVKAKVASFIPLLKEELAKQLLLRNVQSNYIASVMTHEQRKLREISLSCKHKAHTLSQYNVLCCMG